MANEVEMYYFQALEDGIDKLPQEQKEGIFRPCAEACAQQFAFKELKRQFEECHCDLDEQYTKYGRTEYFFADIIEKGHIYEIGYPKCFCPLVESGFAKNPVHCECSRQSIFYVLENLLPNKKFKVETLETLLTGSDKCKFRVTVE